MKQEAKYSPEQIAEICEEIERQWEYLLVTRAAFPINAAPPGWSSPGFYALYGASFHVIVKKVEKPVVPRALQGLPRWLNQNFMIRLFGILEENGVISAGKQAGNEITLIVADLRHLVAHTCGNPDPETKKFQRVAGLIKSNFKPDIDLDKLRDFDLDIQKVLRPLKDRCIDFVRTLKGESIPKKTPATTNG